MPAVNFNILSIILGFASGIGVPIVAEAITSKKNRQLLHKEKVQIIIINLLDETIRETKRQSNALILLLKDVDLEKNYIPSLYSTTLPSLEQLNYRIKQDEYYTAFNRLLKDVLNSKELFFKLKADIVYLYLEIQQTFDLHKDCWYCQHEKGFDASIFYGTIDNKIKGLDKAIERLSGVYEELLNNQVKSKYE